MLWTKEQRYRRIEDASQEEIRNLKKVVKSCRWRQSYHIQPETGLLNDPNGFSYFNGEYHLFYQWFPLGPVHGLKYWYHTKSKDLVHWENAGIAIEPTNQYDSHGVYSGSAIEHEGRLYLLYTGNTRDENWVRHPYQCLAVMNERDEIKKLETPVIASVPNGYTDHFRDPKIWKEGSLFHAIIGAQRENETGCVVLYSSTDLVNWNFKGEINTNLKEFGYMWECPDYLELDNQGILIFCPQGIKPEGDHFYNIYQSGYIMGDKMDKNKMTMVHDAFQELDRGFDFYAPQTMTGPDGRRILVGWMGLPDIEYPTDKNGWAHCLTVPRELSIWNGKLIQQPVKELESLRRKRQDINEVLDHETKVFDEFSGTAFEMICKFVNFDSSEFGVEFRAGEKEKTVIKYDAMEKKVVLDRTFSGEPVAEEYGTVRKCYLDAQSIEFHMYVDTSSVEIFVNNGEEVFTSRIFPEIQSQEIRFFSNGKTLFQATKWDYKG
ncbi:glycoside hydrolase family 32 protein [Bacillus salipaludis]|uniref:Sucrose-6-phosphate hydrolase n=1 Tax=Bacillus salipaludis TaxID=2547811 RepID=A0AA90TW24_9BACI|nr:sucrose-6-phosphate hydrolase [Bacillus salipaludis]MDQ6598873.1 sucrose-6-phosphate hydrolase [Bacillus salipaludis]